MDLNSAIVHNAIKASPLLTDDQREILLAEIAKGEPYSDQLQKAVEEFTNAVILYEIISEELLKEEVEKLEKEISELPERKPNTQDIQARANKIIALTQRYLQEIKKMEKDFEVGAEHTLQAAAKEGENQQVNSLHQFLNKPKK